MSMSPRINAMALTVLRELNETMKSSPAVTVNNLDRFIYDTIAIDRLLTTIRSTNTRGALNQVSKLITGPRGKALVKLLHPSMRTARVKVIELLYETTQMPSILDKDTRKAFYYASELYKEAVEAIRYEVSSKKELKDIEKILKGKKLNNSYVPSVTRGKSGQVFIDEDGKKVDLSSGYDLSKHKEKFLDDLVPEEEEEEIDEEFIQQVLEIQEELGRELSSKELDSLYFQYTNSPSNEIRVRPTAEPEYEGPLSSKGCTLEELQEYLYAKKKQEDIANGIITEDDIEDDRPVPGNTYTPIVNEEYQREYPVQPTKDSSDTTVVFTDNIPLPDIGAKEDHTTSDADEGSEESDPASDGSMEGECENSPSITVSEDEVEDTVVEANEDETKKEFGSAAKLASEILKSYREKIPEVEETDEDKEFDQPTPTFQEVSMDEFFDDLKGDNNEEAINEGNVCDSGSSIEGQGEISGSETNGSDVSIQEDSESDGSLVKEFEEAEEIIFPLDSPEALREFLVEASNKTADELDVNENGELGVYVPIKRPNRQERRRLQKEANKSGKTLEEPEDFVDRIIKEMTEEVEANSDKLPDEYMTLIKEYTEKYTKALELIQVAEKDIRQAIYNEGAMEATVNIFFRSTDNTHTNANTSEEYRQVYELILDARHNALDQRIDFGTLPAVQKLIINLIKAVAEVLGVPARYFHGDGAVCEADIENIPTDGVYDGFNFLAATHPDAYDGYKLDDYALMVRDFTSYTAMGVKYVFDRIHKLDPVGDKSPNTNYWFNPEMNATIIHFSSRVKGEILHDSKAQRQTLGVIAKRLREYYMETFTSDTLKTFPEVLIKTSSDEENTLKILETKLSGVDKYGIGMVEWFLNNRAAMIINLHVKNLLGEAEVTRYLDIGDLGIEHHFNPIKRRFDLNLSLPIIPAHDDVYTVLYPDILDKMQESLKVHLSYYAYLLTDVYEINSIILCNDWEIEEELEETSEDPE